MNAAKTPTAPPVLEADPLDCYAPIVAWLASHESSELYLRQLAEYCVDNLAMSARRRRGLEEIRKIEDYARGWSRTIGDGDNV